MKNLCINSDGFLSIAGVKKVISCTQSQAVIQTESSRVIISGNDIEVKNLDLQNEDIALQGIFYNIKLQSISEKKSLLKRIFK